MADIPNWWLKGDWFDVCSCKMACPCEFAQPPTNNKRQRYQATGMWRCTNGGIRRTLGHSSRRRH